MSAAPDTGAPPAAPATPPATPPAVPDTPITTPVAPTAAWTESLAPELRGEATLGRYKTLDDLARGFLDTKAKLSQKGLILPGKDAKPEEVAEFRKALGVPEAPDKYDLTGFEAPKEGWDPELQTEFLAAAHQHGLPAEAAKGVLSWYAQRSQQERAAVAAKDEEVSKGWDEAVHQKWGAAYDANLTLAQQAFDDLFPGETGLALAQARIPGGGLLRDHPAFIEAMLPLGKLRHEHGLSGGRDGAPSGVYTPEGAQTEKAKLLADAEFKKAVFDKRHPRHKEFNDKLLSLERMILGEKP